MSQFTNRIVRRFKLFVPAALPLLFCLLPATSATAVSVVLDETVQMTCFPPQAMMPPPCPTPEGVAPIAPNPEGTARVRVLSDESARIVVRLSGMDPSQRATAWFIHFPPVGPIPDPIFEPIGPGLPAIAHMDTPLAPIDARFADGLSIEPNELVIRGSGNAKLRVALDYNPLKPNQVPLINALSPVTQTLVPVESGLAQGTCCPDFPAGPRIEPIGGSFLRHFDPETGLQLLDHNGRPQIARSPTRPVAIAVFIHHDGSTSGMLPGIPTPPFLPATTAATGTFYLLGIFPLGALLAGE